MLYYTILDYTVLYSDIVQYMYMSPRLDQASDDSRWKDQKQISRTSESTLGRKASMASIRIAIIVIILIMIIMILYIYIYICCISIIIIMIMIIIMMTL